MRTLLPGDRQRGSVLRLLGPIQHHHRKDYESLCLLDKWDQRGMVQPDAIESCQPARHVGAVRIRSPLCARLRAQQMFLLVSFDLCTDTGAAQAFFPAGHMALTGSYQEVACCDEWTGTDGPSLWDGACLLGEDAPFWPSTACGNQGTGVSLPAQRYVLIHGYRRQCTLNRRCEKTKMVVSRYSDDGGPEMR